MCFFRCCLGLLKGIIHTYSKSVKLQLVSVCGQLFYIKHILLDKRFNVTL